MIRNRLSCLCLLLMVLLPCACNTGSGAAGSFDVFKKAVTIGNWAFTLDVENQDKKAGNTMTALKQHYLKATLFLANVKTKQSMLYSLSKTTEDYEGMYKYLSFGSRNDLCIKSGDHTIYPIGYVFEPSNGLGNSERLVYKFQLDDALYQSLSGSQRVEYWFTDRLIGLGKICFTQNN